MRRLLESPEEVGGVFATLSDPAVVEMLALAGFGFALIDLEHTAIELGVLANHVRAAKQHGLATLVRVADESPKTILRVLETGADGVLVPHVETAEDARAAVEAVRYPPLGHRGFYDGTPAAQYFAHGYATYRELADAANAAVVLGVLIEDGAGVENCAEIAATPGVDLVVVGPADLGFSTGRTTAGDPVLAEAIDRVRAAARDAGVAFCAPTNHPLYGMSAADLRALGDRIFLAGSDCGALMAGLRSTWRELQPA
jgi:2-keto-3-deoxy-L-rhamnonate aldolase RhmA